MGGIHSFRRLGVLVSDAPCIYQDFHGKRTASRVWQVDFDEMGRFESGSSDSFGTFSVTAIWGGERRKTPTDQPSVLVSCRLRGRL